VRHATRAEWRWVLTVSALILILSSAPYLAGYAAQTSTLRFSGAVMDRMDYHSHLAKMWQGYRGEWKYRLLFTPELHQGAYLQTFYVALGHLARLFGLGLPLVYQIARVLFGLLMLVTIYSFVARFASSTRARRVAFLLATTASGLGWLTEILAPTPAGGISPMDFWLLDGFTYLALLTSPHFCAAIALLLTIFLLLLHREEGPRPGEAALAAAASLALGLIHPYTLLLADLLPALHFALAAIRHRRLPWRGVLALAAMGLVQLPLLAYDLWVFRSQPVFAAWSAQNVTLSPPPRIYLWGYGLLLLLAGAGVLRRARRGEFGLAFPLIWIAVVAVLIYLPWNLQRRFLEGVQVPLGLLAGVGLAEGVFAQGGDQKGLQWRWMGRSFLIGLAALSNLYLTAGLTLAAGTRAPKLFWPAQTLDAVDWLGRSSSWEETVLGAGETGSLIPARIGHRVVLGHAMESVDFEARQAAVRAFYGGGGQVERRALLRDWGVVYVFHGPAERVLGDFNPATAPYLRRVYAAGGVAVYRVSLEGQP